MLPKNWPHWIVIPIGLFLAVASIALGLVLEPAVQSLAQHPEPTPTLPCLHYAAPLSEECATCHTDQQKIASLALSESESHRLHIEPSAIDSPHGRLGCVTCHGGTPGTSELDAAHQELVADPSTRFEATCILCHPDLRASGSEELLHRPHQPALDSPHQIKCSDCHGAVGHGFNAPDGRTICSMDACLDCHEQWNLDIQSQDCDSCHVGPHDVAAALSCSDCHISVREWNETRLSVHPVRLDGAHAETDCFACHRWPNFRGLDYQCNACHQRPHDFGSDQCASCHQPDGWSAATMEGHPFSIRHGGADGECATCHRGTDTSSYYCFTCHSETTTVNFHAALGQEDVLGKCADCHSNQ